MGKACSCCSDVRNGRKDFRQDHGGGPEVPPHRKKKNKNRSGQKKTDHKHLWESNGWEKKYRQVYKRLDTPRWGLYYTYVEDRTRWCLVRRFFCLECNKAGKVEYEYPMGRSFYYEFLYG